MSADAELSGMDDPLKVSFNLQRRDLAAVNELATFRRVSRSEWIRRAIRHAIDREHQFQRGRLGDPGEWVAES